MTKKHKFKFKLPSWSKIPLWVWLIGFFLVFAFGTGIFAVAAYKHFSHDLPEHEQLKNYTPAMVTRIYARDGSLLSEYATQKRIFVKSEDIPKLLIQAFMAAEDKNFYTHSGLDYMGMLRAGLINLVHIGSNRRPMGASTITQQVAKNFLLTNEVSLDRKFKEAILALRIEKMLTKEEILELYLNEIYLGMDSYGVVVAAQNYFGKSLEELTVPEVAYLASLPKAPNNYHPIRHPEAAKARRDWVVDRMFEDGYITKEERDQAIEESLNVKIKDKAAVNATSNYFTEDVRRTIAEQYGQESLYKGGMAVYTTVDPKLQAVADDALYNGLVAYDRRHGWRGAISHIDNLTDWLAALKKMPLPAGSKDWKLAVVLGMDATKVEIGLQDGSHALIPLDELKWARKKISEDRFGAVVSQPKDVLANGDIVLVEERAKNDKGKPYPPRTFTLRQIPDVDGALVAMDVHSGQVVAMSGGYDFGRSEFNRATQAMRQPGSSFKPFVYLAGLENGFTPATIIDDAPIEIDQGPFLPKWRPENFANDFYGPTPMRVGLEHSRNLMTIRIAQKVGMERIVEIADQFGISDKLPAVLSSSIGAGETTVMHMTSAYATLANGGRKVSPIMIDRVQDKTGKTIFKADPRKCNDCNADWYNQGIPNVQDERPTLSDPISIYQLVSMMQGVVERGTGTLAKIDGYSIAGKTGTTNDSLDNWFIGFTPDLVVAVFVGFDTPKSLGKKDTGGLNCAPVFKQFMMQALKGVPPRPFTAPEGVRFVWVNHKTGQPASEGEKDAILESFKPGTEPGGSSYVDMFGLDNGPSPEGANDNEAAPSADEGLY